MGSNVFLYLESLPEIIGDEVMRYLVLGTDIRKNNNCEVLVHKGKHINTSATNQRRLPREKRGYE